MMTAKEKQRLDHLESELAQVKGMLRKLGYVFPEDDNDPLTWEEVIQSCIGVNGTTEKLERWMALGRSIPKELPP